MNLSNSKAKVNLRVKYRSYDVAIGRFLKPEYMTSPRETIRLGVHRKIFHQRGCLIAAPIVILRMDLA